MKTNELHLAEVFKSMLAEQLAAEKKYQKLFDKLPKLIHTDEMRLAISPGETDIETHISRLTSAMASLKQKATPALSGFDEETLKTLKATAVKTVSLHKDLQLLEIFKALYNFKVSRYDSLYRMAAVLGHEEHAMLLEQCSKDNQNTYAYLNQISQNVIYPEVNETIPAAES
jgi:ferritin-like metal-binding protein YciE